MAFYLLQVRYNQPAMKAMVDHPQDRTEAARKAVEAFGGKLHQFFFAFGEYDAVVISEFPDNESCTAALMMVNAAGGVASTKTTPLISAQEAMSAMKRAGSTASGYRPAQG